MKNNLTILLVLISFTIHSQNYKFGKVSKEELGEKVKIKVEYDDILGYPSIIRVKHPGTDGNISLLISNVVIK